MSGADSAKLHTIYNGVDTERFRPRETDDDDNVEIVRRRLEVAPGTRLLLFVGNLLPVKNPRFLLRAFAACVFLHEVDAVLVMVGTGPMEPELRRLSSELGVEERMRWLGQQSSGEVAELMGAADLLCLASRSEGLPNVILEASAAGLPVLSTDVGGIHEVVTEPWQGILVDRDDLEAYGETMAELLRQEPDSDRRRRIRAVGERFSWERCAAAYRKVLADAVAG